MQTAAGQTRPAAPASTARNPAPAYTRSVDGSDTEKGGQPRPKKASTKRRLKKREIIEAILGARGILLVAANNLACARQTLYKRAQQDPDIQAAIDQGREALKDYAEGRLVALMAKDTGPGVTAVIFYLKTQAKERGYIESQTINLRGITPQELEQMSDAELDAAEAALGG